MKFKIIAYNILTGLCDWDFSNKLPVIDKKRLSLAKKLIKQENPDILCLTEAFFSSKNYKGVYMDYQEIFNYPYVDVRKSNVILSKFPIIYSKEFGKQGHNHKGLGLYCQVMVGKKNIPISLIHPNIWANESKRLELIKDLFDEKNNMIICGDFNSISKSDNYSKEFAENFRKKVIFRHNGKGDLKNSNTIMKDTFNPKVVKYIEKKGFVDTYKLKNNKFDFTVPTDFLSKDKSTGIRIDFIFVRWLKVLDAGIIKNSLSEKASDHYPVYAVLEI
ncbi:endonuclease/exonuclease/phosphatase family protein [Candidatus Pacearchaeota archaeon]|nr:endonuclease/exonuclease/phosphatase family protein [Candidatus Pacearchaeota archaeon]